MLVEEVIEAARARYAVTVEELRTAFEDITFKLPKPLLDGGAPSRPIPADA